MNMKYLMVLFKGKPCSLMNVFYPCRSRVFVSSNSPTCRAQYWTQRGLLNETVRVVHKFEALTIKVFGTEEYFEKCITIERLVKLWGTRNCKFLFSISCQKARYKNSPQGYDTLNRTPCFMRSRIFACGMFITLAGRFQTHSSVTSKQLRELNFKRINTR